MTTTLLPSSVLPGHLIGATYQSAENCAPRYRLGNPGRPSTTPTLVITLFDNSGSVTSPTGTDPLSNRFGEIDHALTMVARKGAEHELGAVLHFDTPTSADVPPVPLTRHGLPTLRRGLWAPADGAGTSELAPSLTRAVELARDHPDHTVTLVVLSDFLLLDADPGQVLSDLAGFPGSVHAVVLSTRLPDGVLGDDITTTRVTRTDPPGAVARALFTSLTAHRPGAKPAHD